MVTKSDTYIGHVVYAVIERYRIIKAASNLGALIRCRLDKVKDLVFCGVCLTFVKVAHALDCQYGGTWKAEKKWCKRKVRPMDIFSASNKATYDRRKKMVAERWAEYEGDQNPIHLAAICRELPFFDHPQVGQEIARLLLADLYNDLDQLSEPCP